MICDICGQAAASVHLTEIVDNQMIELHLCEKCAKEKSAQIEQPLGLSDFLAGLADLGKQFEDDGKRGVQKCGNCGLSYDDFKKIGRLGCSECYNTFRSSLVSLLRKIHGSTKHIGKDPGQAGKTAFVAESEIDILRENLKKAIESEEFETAAKLRDKIKTVEKKQNKSSKRWNKSQSISG